MPVMKCSTSTRSWGNGCVRSPEGYHGTVIGYTYGCRLECCRNAMAKYQAERRQLLRRRKTPKHVHGTLNGYVSYGCRCDQCTGSNRAYKQKLKALKDNANQQAEKS